MKTSILLRHIITLLTPMLLTATGGDQDQAEAAAVQTVNAYAARHPIELLLVAQSIAFGIATLSSVSLSMAENIPINLILRLRNNAVSLHRAAERCRQALPDPLDTTAEPLELEPPPPTMPAALAALAADSERRIAEADAAVKATGAPIPPRRPGASVNDEDSFRAAWSAAMTDVANEMQAEMPNLSPTDRRLASQRINALTATAANLTKPPRG